MAAGVVSFISSYFDVKAMLKEYYTLFYSIVVFKVRYLNNRVEQDYRFIKRLTKPGMEFGSFNAERRTIGGFKAMNMIRKGQVQGV